MKGHLNGNGWGIDVLVGGHTLGYQMGVKTRKPNNSEEREETNEENYRSTRCFLERCEERSSLGSRVVDEVSHRGDKVRHRRCDEVDNKQGEISVVASPDTVADPRAVMVKLLNTVIAHATV